VQLLADGREGEFRNRYRLTYPVRHDPHRIVWQIDHKAPLHVLVRDLRAPSHRSAYGEVRPFLTIVVDSASRLLVTGLLGYDPPNRFTVATAIRNAILTSEHKPFGGIPDEIWIDNGKDLVAQHVYQLVEGLDIKLVAGPPHQPQVRGIVERLHKTLDTRLWSTLPGYVGPNVVKRNPMAKAQLTLAQLDEYFRDFVERYHHEVHSETGQTPLAFWQEHATPLPVDEHILRLLDVLLKEPANRRVLKEGIKYLGERYWHPELAVLVGEDVLVRAAPHYTAPAEIEVFFDGQWRCTAFALTSPQGQALERPVVAAAQRRQRMHARQRISTAQEMVHTHVTSTDSPASTSTSKQQRKQQRKRHSSDTFDLPVSSSASVPPFSLVSPRCSQDLFDFLVAQRTPPQQTE
jgi:transposase InsO family protein